MCTDAAGDRVRVLQVAVGERACGIEARRADGEHRPLQQDRVNAPAGEWPGYFCFLGRMAGGQKKLSTAWGEIEKKVG